MKVIDLSIEIKDGMNVYKGDPQVKIDVVCTYEQNSWLLRNISMGTHTGTHVDAFSHMHKDKDTLNDIPLERFFGNAQVVNKSDNFPLKTGLFFIEEVDNDSFNKILASDPGFVGGNISEDLERKLLANNIITYTNLINLEKILKNRNFMFYGLPLKIKDGDGSPVRAMAIIED